MISRTDRINEMTRLIMHRLYVRVLRRHPRYLAEARLWVEEGGGSSSVPYMKLWNSALALPDERLLRVLVSYHENAVWLRQTSPFGMLIPRELVGIDYRDTATRRRVWRKASLMVDLLLSKGEERKTGMPDGTTFWDLTVTHRDEFHV
jgi:hypothetical protein